MPTANGPCNHSEGEEDSIPEKQTVLQIRPEAHRHRDTALGVQTCTLEEVRHQQTYLGSTVLAGPNFGFGVEYERPAQHLPGARDGREGLSGELSFIDVSASEGRSTGL